MKKNGVGLLVKPRAGSLLAALFLSFTVSGESDHVILLLLLLFGEHLLLGFEHQLCDAVEHLRVRHRQKDSVGKSH